MSSISSDVKAIYRTASDRVQNTRYELVSGPAWLRGVVFFVNAQPGSVSGANRVRFFDGSSGDQKLNLGVGGQFTMSQFVIPDESYIDCPNGIWFDGGSEVIIDALYLTVFYSQ